MCFRCERPFYRKPSNLQDYLQYRSVWLCDDCLRGLDGKDRRTPLRRLPSEASKHLGKVLGAVKALVPTGLMAAHKHLRLVPLIEPPDYITESRRLMKETTPKKIRARDSMTRRVIVEHLHYDYRFTSWLWGRIFIFADLMEARACFDCVQRMDEYTRSGFQLQFLSPTVLRAKVKGRHYL